MVRNLTATRRRSQWRRDGDDAYIVVSEVKVADGWKEAWRVRMQRQK